MSNFITHENPIVFLPKLAKVLGTNESLILSLIHYWINPKYNQNFKDNRFWVYNSYEQWQKKLPNLSVITIRRAINKLEKLGILISDKLSNIPYLQVKWYSIDYDALYQIIPNEIIPHESKRKMPSDIKVATSTISHSLKALRKKFTSDQNEQGGDQFEQIIYNDTNNTTNNLDKQKGNVSFRTPEQIKENEILSFSATFFDKNLEQEEQITPRSETPSKVLKFYPKRTLKDWYPLSKDEVGCINWDSGREFATNFANQLLLKLSKSNTKGVFPTKYHLRKYLTKAFKNELRQGPEVNHDSFKLKCNLDKKLIQKQKERTANYNSISKKEEVKQKQANKEATISNPIWKEVCEKLKSALGEELHKSWTGKLEYLDNDQETNIDDSKVIRLKAPSRFIGDTIKDRYFYNIKKAFEEIGLGRARVAIEVPTRPIERSVYSLN